MSGQAIVLRIADRLRNRQTAAGRHPLTAMAPAARLLPLAVALLAAGPPVATSPAVVNAQECRVLAERVYGVSRGVQWGDEVTITILADVDCPAGAGRLSITERLPAGIAFLPGIGREPDELTDGDPTWHFDPPHDAGVRLTYRVYATPPIDEFDAAGEQWVGWPMALDLVVGGRTVRQDPPTVPQLLVGERQSRMTCGLARGRLITPDTVIANHEFTVTLRLTLNQCPPFAKRTRGILAIQPVADVQDLRHLQMAVTRILGQLGPPNGLMGIVVNRATGVATQWPTTEYIFVDTIARAMSPAAGGGDAVAALQAAIDMLPNAWPFHHEVVFHVTNGGAPPADPAALRAALDQAAGRRPWDRDRVDLRRRQLRSGPNLRSRLPELPRVSAARGWRPQYAPR